MDPNSTHQMWSEWVFEIHDLGRPKPLGEVELNAAKWLRQGFGSTGKANVIRTVLGWRIEAIVEGVPVHDPDYVLAVKKGFKRFVEQGWGPLAFGRVRSRLLAGDRQDGKPPEQWVEMPTIPLAES